MLKDGMYYEETDKKADQKTSKMITKLLHEREGELHKEEIDYITNFKAIFMDCQKCIKVK